MYTYFSTHKKAKPNLAMWSREETSTYIVQYFSVNFDKKILTIEFEPTQLEILRDGGKFVGFKDFVKSIFKVNVHYFYNANEIMQNFSLKRTWIINGGKKYIIEFNEEERSLSNNSLPNTYIHVIKEKEFIH
jgi:hypothetical protein